MPLRDFRCRACGKTHELLVRARDADPINCPPDPDGEGCGATESLERVEGVGRTSFKLAGSGWAAEGYSRTSRGAS